MSETSVNESRPRRVFRHRGRTSQIPIYLGKQLRFFINESDWKVIPMAAVIAGLVAMVIRNKMFLNMEGTLIGAFALTCVAIWNGSFNSIQAVCRERAIIKREHRSGMHISSYVIAHMIYQLLLCLAQTGVTMYVLKTVGVKFPAQGFITRWMIVDIGITMLLIAYASDMMSLFISSISHTTTSAMTIMPFVLIFQLVFSGSIIPLPAWSQALSDFTISNYGIRALAAQSDYNGLPMVSVWNTLNGMKNKEIVEEVTLGRVLDILNSDAVAKHREEIVVPSLTAGEAAAILQIQIPDESKETVLTDPVSLGELLDLVNENESIQQNRDQSYTIRTSVGEVLSILGEENVKTMIQTKIAEASQKEEFEHSKTNIALNWVMLGFFILVFAALATISLELIDKDKR